MYEAANIGFGPTISIIIHCEFISGLLTKKQYTTTGARKLFCLPDSDKVRGVGDRPVDISLDSVQPHKATPEGLTRGLSRTEYRKIVDKALMGGSSKLS